MGPSEKMNEQELMVLYSDEKYLDEARARIARAKSGSQALRFAIFEFYIAKGKANEIKFDKFYDKEIADLVDHYLVRAKEVAS